MRKLLVALLLVPSLARASQIVNPAASSGGGGSSTGTVNSGTINQVAYYNVTGSTISGTNVLKVYASSSAAGGILDMSSNKIVNITNGSNPADSVNFLQLGWENQANVLINGGMDVWQRWTSTQPANGTYTGDRWQTSTSARNVGHVTASQDTVTVHDGKYSMKIVFDGSTNAGDSFDQTQPVENYYDYAGGSVTVSGWANSNQPVQICVGDNLGNTCSSAYSTGTGGWQQLTATRFLAAAITSLNVKLRNIGAQISETDYFDSIMLLPGDTAGQWRNRPLSVELQLCQRYYEKAGNFSMTVNSSGVSGNDYYTFVPFAVNKRTSTPTVTVTCGSATNESGMNADTKDARGFNMNINCSGAGKCQCYNGTWTADAEM